MRKNYLVILIFLGFSLTAFAQQDAQFSQYMFNGMYFNPGYTGIENVSRLNLISRAQWLAYKPTNTSEPSNGVGAIQSNILSFSSPLKNYKIGIGGYLLYERLGPMQNINFNLSVSKHFQLNNGKLGIGLNGGVYSQKLFQSYVVVNQSDPIYQYLINPNNQISQIKPDLNAGVWYEHQKYYLGVSLYHIPSASFSFGDSTVVSKLAHHMYITGGYRIHPFVSLEVTPSFMVQTDFNQLTYLFGALAEYNKKMWVGINLRQSFGKRYVSTGGKTLSNDDIILYVGINLLKNQHNQDALRVGYSFDFVTSGVQAKTRTSHEIMLSYFIPPIGAKSKPPVRTPRYRHGD